MKYDFYTTVYLWLIQHRKGALILTSLVALSCLFLSSRISLDEDILSTLPQNDSLVDAHRYSLTKFRQMDRVYLDIGSDGTDTDFLISAADDLYAILASDPDYNHVLYRLQMDAYHNFVTLLTEALPNLFTEENWSELESKLETSNLRDYLILMRQKLSGPEGMVLKGLVEADPIGMSDLVFRKLLPLQTGFGEAQVVDGRILSGDGEHILIVAEPHFAPSNSKSTARLVENLLNAARTVEASHPGIKVSITGGHRMTLDNASMIKSDATRCIFLGMTAMFILCLVAYRRGWLGIVTFVPSLLGTLVAGVVISLFYPSFSAIATGFAVIAIGITVDYAIHVVYHIDDAPPLKGRAMGRHLGRLVFPVGVGCLTSIAAFLVMTRSSMAGYQQLGFFGAIGVFVSALCALLILPLLIPNSRKQESTSSWLTRAWESFYQWRSRRLPYLLAGVILLTLFSLLGISKLKFEGDISKLNGITESTRNDEAQIRHTWGEALGLTMIVVRGDTPDAALFKNDEVRRHLQEESGVEGIFSLSDILPSESSQRENRLRWKRFWTEERKKDFEMNLQNIADELGYTKDVWSSLIQKIDQTPPSLQLDSLLATPLRRTLDERIAFDDTDFAISTLVKVKDTETVQRLSQSLKGTIVLSQATFAQHIADLARSELKQFVLWTTILVTVVLFICYGSIELVAATLIPLGFGMLWCFGLMGWFGLPIDMMNGIFVVFVLGIGEDYSVFLVTSKLDEWRGRPKRLAATSASVSISSLTTLFGFAVLVFAQHPVLYSVGTTVLLGMTGALCATLILTPLCMDLLLFKRPPRGAPKAWHLLGTLWAAIYLIGSQVFLYGLLRPALKVIFPGSADQKLRQAVRIAICLLIRSIPYCKIQINGISEETFRKPAIIVSNHLSALDVLLMVMLPADIRMTVKKRVWDTPILGIGCKLLGHVMVDPKRPRRTLEQCRDRLQGGSFVHFFPEGTRSHDGSLLQFHRGAFELAIQLNMEILPIVLCEPQVLMPRDSYWFEPGTMSLSAIPRIGPEQFDYSLGSEALTRHCESVIEEELRKEWNRLNTEPQVSRKVKRLYRYQGIFVEHFVHWKLKKDPLFNDLNRVVPRAGFILDLGCGYGTATHWLSAYSIERTFLGMDFDEDKIRIATQSAGTHPHISFKLADLLEVDFPMCDVVLLLDVLHYWPLDKQEFLLKKIHRALKPGGTLILREGVREESKAYRNLVKSEAFTTRTGMNLPGEKLCFPSLQELRAMLERAGFCQVCEIQRDIRFSNILLTSVASDA